MGKQRHYFLHRGIDVERTPSIIEVPGVRGATRHGCTDHRSSLPVTQAFSGCGVYATEKERFAAGNRGLHANIVSHEDKLRAAVLGEVRAARRRGLEQRVMANCRAVDQHPLDVTEARVARVRASNNAADARALAKNQEYQARHC
jgi:hypothetical protein